MTAVDHSPQVDSHDPLPVVEAVFLEFAPVTHTRIVTEDIHPPHPLVSAVAEFLHLPRLRDVDHLRQDVAAERLELPTDPGEPLAVDVAQ